MRSTVLSLAAVLCTSVTQAQVTKGTVQLGPELAYGRTKQEDGSYSYKSSGSVINLTAGYAVKENRVLGLSGGVTITQNGGRSTSQNVGIFYRRYYSLAKQFAWFIQPAASFAWASPQNAKMKTWTGSFGPGACFLAKPWLQLELSMPELLSIRHGEYDQNVGVISQHSESFGVGLLSGDGFGSNLIHVGARINIK